MGAKRKRKLLFSAAELRQLWHIKQRHELSDISLAWERLKEPKQGGSKKVWSDADKMDMAARVDELKKVYETNKEAAPAKRAIEQYYAEEFGAAPANSQSAHRRLREGRALNRQRAAAFKG